MGIIWGLIFVIVNVTYGFVRKRFLRNSRRRRISLRRNNEN